MESDDKMPPEETKLVTSLSTDDMGNCDGDGNNIFSTDTINIDDGGGKMPPEEAQNKDPKTERKELSQEAREFGTDVFKAVMTDMEKSFHSEPKYRICHMSKKFLKDLMSSIISAQ